MFLEAEREIAALPDEVTAELSRDILARIDEQLEELLEDALHNKSNGPCHLSDQRLVKIILDSWMWLMENRDLYVYAICVMSNHVHILVRGPQDGPALDPALISRTHKSFTGGTLQ